MLRLGIPAMAGVGALAAVVACTNSADLGGATGVGPDGGQEGGSSGSSGTGTPNACTAPTGEPTCEAAVDVATADEAAAFIGALAVPKFTSTTSDSGTSLKPTRDLRVTAAIALDVTRFRGTEEACAGKDPSSCHESWAFSGEKNAPWNFAVSGGTPARPLPPGVLCSDVACSTIAIEAGTVVRFQRVFEPNQHASIYAHYVRVVRPCATPCDGNELRCTDSTTCIQRKAFCTLCEGHKNEVCACRDGCSALAEGERCTYVSSDDTGDVGVCTAGTCGRAP